MDGQNSNSSASNISKEEFISDKDEYQYFLEDQNTCCLCGTHLVFKHKIDYMTLQVTEDADCPSCRIRLKTKDHGLN